MTALSKQTEDLLEDLAAELEIPPSRYDSAERRYKSVREWLDRLASRFSRTKTSIYAQGSFRLGTVIRPATDNEDYDLDTVWEVDVSKVQLTQEQLKTELGMELSAYAEAHEMELPESGRRCWTLNYADGARFHMDVLPAIPDGVRQAAIIKDKTGASPEWTKHAIAITDTQHTFYRRQTDDWPSSNPKGYAECFKSRMQTVFDARRSALAMREGRASSEEIPEYRVKTPLQSAIQILKRHRDITFFERPDAKPISIIITTLAAQAYNQETTISDGAVFNPDWDGQVY